MKQSFRKNMVLRHFRCMFFGFSPLSIGILGYFFVLNIAHVICSLDIVRSRASYLSLEITNERKSCPANGLYLSDYQ